MRSKGSCFSTMRRSGTACALAAVLASMGPPATARAADLTPQQQAFRAIYQELVEINTTDSIGDTVKSAEAMAARLRSGGIPA